MEQKEYSYFVHEKNKEENISGNIEIRDIKGYYQEIINDEHEEINANNLFTITKYEPLGSLAFCLIEDKEKYKENEIKLIRMYIDECILNEQCGSTEVLLVFIRNILQRELPKIQCWSNEKNDGKIEKIKDNKSKIQFWTDNKKELDIEKVYGCKDYIDIVLCSLYEIFSNNQVIKRCENCNRYFTSKKNDSRTIYCNYVAPQDKNKTCREMKNRIQYINKRREDKMQYEYNKLIEKYRRRRERLVDKQINGSDSNTIKELEEKIIELQDIYEDIKRHIKEKNITKDEGTEIIINYEKGGKEKWLFKK